MLTTSPRRLATITFLSIILLLYLVATASHRLSTVGTFKDIHSHKDNHASDTHADPETPSGLGHHHNSIVPTRAPLPPSEAAPGDSNRNEPSTGTPVKVSKIHQVTMILDGDGPEHEVYERALKTHLAHAERWGYETHILREDIVGSGKSGRDSKGHWQSGVFKKPLYLLSLVINELAKPKEERAEWIIWIDGDTIILNPNIPFEAFLPPSDQLFDSIHFLGSQDWNGFNCGVFFMRVHEWNVQLLTDVAAVPRLRPDLELYGQPDQNAMKYLFRESGRKDTVLYQPKHWYNAYHSGKDNMTEIREGQGELLVHFAGFYGNRTAAMQEWFEKIETEPEKYAIPMEKTRIKQEVDGFWSALREGKVLLQDMGPKMEEKNTTAQLKAFETLQNAVSWYPWDKKRFEEARRQAQTAMGLEKHPKEEEIPRKDNDVVPQEQDNVLAEEEKKLQEADKAKQKLDTPPRSNEPSSVKSFQ